VRRRSSPRARRAGLPAQIATPRASRSRPLAGRQAPFTARARAGTVLPTPTEESHADAPPGPAAHRPGRTRRRRRGACDGRAPPLGGPRGRAPARARPARRSGCARRGRARPRGRPDDPPRERPRRSGAADADARRRSVPGRQHHEDLRRDGRPPTRRRGKALARGPGRALAARARPERRCDHRPPAPEPHERTVRLPRGPAGQGPHPAWRRHPRLGSAQARRDRELARAPLRARGRVVVLEHGLHPAGADRRGGERASPRQGARAADLRAARPARHEPGHEGADQRAPRARLREARQAAAA
jgi:hypothetical protein